MAGVGSPALDGTTSFLRRVGNGSGTGGQGAAGGSTQERPFNLEPEWLGTDKIDDPYDSREYFEIGNSFDTDAHRDDLVERQYSEMERQQEAARSPEQQMDNYPYYYWNLAQNNPRGNLNRRTYETTLRMSRLADAVNNRLHWSPGTATTIGGAGGAKAVGQGSPTVSQWEPIETQEMRQMRANERMDERAREAGIDLQSDIQAYPQELQKAGDENARRLRYYISQMDDDYVSWFQKYVIEQEYGGSWEYYFRKEFENYITKLKLDTKSRVYRELSKLAPAVAREFGQFFGYIPMTASHYFIESFMRQIRNDSTLTDDTKAIIEAAIISTFGGIYSHGASKQVKGYLKDVLGIGGSGSSESAVDAYINTHNNNRGANKIF